MGRLSPATIAGSDGREGNADHRNHSSRSGRLLKIRPRMSHSTAAESADSDVRVSSAPYSGYVIGVRTHRRRRSGW